MNRFARLGAIMIVAVASGGAPAWGADAAAMGRALYHGHAGFERGREATSNRLPGAFAACARCHGSLGEGSREGGVSPPPLTGTALTSPRGNLPAFEDDAAIMRAVVEGRSRDGTTLSAAMPRYRLSDAEAASLLAYLRVLGGAEDLPPGVSNDSVRIGALLPLSGADAASGNAALAGLRETFDDVNAQGGVYGRRLDLVVVDSASRGGLPAARELLAQHPYALVGGMWNAHEAAVGAAFSQNRVAKLGNLVRHDRESDLDEWDADLFAPRDQGAADMDAPADWRLRGGVAARLAVELLSRAGVALYERALLEQLPRTNGVELAPGAPARFSKTRRYAFDFEAAGALSASQTR